MQIESFALAAIESISQILGVTSEELTGSQITKFLEECNISDPSLNSTKWKRLDDSLRLKQKLDHCANNIIAFTEYVMKPFRHFNNKEWFETTRNKLNKIFSFEGFELQYTGIIRKVTQIKTIYEAEKRASKLKQSLLLRKAHPDILHFCKAELLADNYFHAVFEATKSIAEKIRSKTGLTNDGAALVDEAFTFKNKAPHLVLSLLKTESEKSKQKDFANLLGGVFGTFRNTTIHASNKVILVIEDQDTLDVLSTISLFHRGLDSAIGRKENVSREALTS